MGVACFLLFFVFVDDSECAELGGSGGGFGESNAGGVVAIVDIPTSEMDVAGFGSLDFRFDPTVLIPLPVVSIRRP